mmetsp:Transcript_49303/g.86141  ORF Transcript_49303/g.86141 Transcript_49303/m.86141 type:complete len:287 (-) Transcript_49303:475-1335(-)
MVQGFDDLQDVGVDFTHVVGLAEEGLAVKLPAMVRASVLDALTHAEVCLTPLEQHVAGLLDEALAGAEVHRQDVRQFDTLAHTAGQRFGDVLHQRRHALVGVVVARDDPHHAQTIHHRLHRLQNGLIRALSNVFEMALQGCEELHIVFGLQVQLGQLAEVEVETAQLRDVHELHDLHHELHFWGVDLVKQHTQIGIAIAPELNLPQRRALRLGHLLVLAFHSAGHHGCPVLQRHLHAGHNVRVLDGCLRVDNVQIGNGQARVAAGLHHQMTDLLFEFVDVYVELVA